MATKWTTTVTDLCAPLRFDCAGFRGFVATIAAIEVAPFVVFAVVAIAVSLELLVLALGSCCTLAVWIQALALRSIEIFGITCDEYDNILATQCKTIVTDLCAPLRFDCAGFRGFFATVAAIELAPFVVVAVVAVAVSLVILILALSRWRALATWIQALALRSMGIFDITRDAYVN